jgi:HEAT repeat protein
MSAREGALEPFAGMEDSAELQPARARVREIAVALEPSVVALSRHPDPAVRTKAIVLLSRSSTDTASAAIAQAVTDPNDSVQRVALSSIGQRGDAKSVAAVAKVMRSHEGWAMRVLAAQALGRLGASGKGDIASKDAARHLGEAAKKESFALVREAALVALASFDKPSAATTAAQMEKSDPEPRVRETAAKIRAGK